MNCELCDRDSGEVLYRDNFLRVVLVTNEPDYPAFCRVILNAHVKEMTDLSAADRTRLMAWVFRTEAALRAVLNPDKINLATLGNVVPHLHWHVIPRFADDAHFPAPIWATRQRDGVVHRVEALAERLRAALES
ncbi:HIT family protein [Crenobacter sp. SG2305]|uniref:HIT family protein n=1 Tax=Crenobacter oryzisoli TaxID=3056844 RepID=UPI0025AA71D4|nr:HIT family protein [Crenobacter sp. SG2305]MDN0083048.1 HIT family protein [Crenobacter sp. SG2305]